MSRSVVRHRAALAAGLLARAVVLRRHGRAGCTTVRSPVVADGDDAEIEGAAVVGGSFPLSAVTVLDVDGSAVA